MKTNNNNLTIKESNLVVKALSNKDTLRTVILRRAKRCNKTDLGMLAERYTISERIIYRYIRRLSFKGVLNYCMDVNNPHKAQLSYNY